MVTAQAACSTTRTRRPAGPLHVLWLAALLIAFLYTHAAGADSVSAHVTGGAVAVPHLTAAESEGAPGLAIERPDGAGDDSDHWHPAEACASGQPQQSRDLPVPHLAPLGELTGAVAGMTRQRWAQTLPAMLPPVRSSLSSVVQQV
ncbi:hypothetical protein QEZ40_000310 [Streptomyces katrae]|uniref:Secreted protein n=1 Tax=Streptomyces katrae TaxID=68223 RepID=A0ABT7GLH6_9ACTN|nr:hypothetical protein [Streptomyces katrae]MDK9494437.1 hypothetical protein [Streptomyces katrae]